jgi:hypothetical protein
MRANRNEAMKTETLQLETIRLDGGTQQREAIDENHVAELSEAVKAGRSLPPGRVYFDGSDYWLARGFHRWHAHKRAGKAAMECEVVTGSKREAVLDACGDNSDHGLKRTNADKRKAVLTLLRDEEWGGRSDRWIADAAKVSGPFVANLRAATSLPAAPTHQETPTANVCSSRTGKDGKERAYAPHGTGKKKGGKKKDEPAKPSPAPSTNGTHPPPAATPPPPPPAPLPSGVAATITDVLERINGTGAAIESYASSEEGRTTDVPKAIGLLKQVKAAVVGGGRPHVLASDVAMPPTLDTSECRNALDLWLVFKRKGNGAYKDAKQVELQVKRFADFTPSEFVSAVEYSIAQNYQGLHAEKSHGNGFSKAPRKPGPGERFDPTAQLGSL